MISSQSTTPHPLASLLEIWERVSEGQRQAIARDFHIRTGGMMDTRPHPTPKVVPLLAMETPSGKVGLLVGPGNKLPFFSVGMELSVSQTTRQFIEDIFSSTVVLKQPTSQPKATPTLTVDRMSKRSQDVEFSSFFEPVVSETGLYLFQSSTSMICLADKPDFLPKTWSVASADEVVCAQYLQEGVNTWAGIAPLRYLGTRSR